MSTKPLSIVNTTRYNTDDVMAIVNAAFGKDLSEKKVKIRSLVKPKKYMEYRGRERVTAFRWVYLGDPWHDTLEIAILKPDRLGETVLDALANVDPNFAHSKIISDLIYLCKKATSITKQVDPTQFKIRLLEEADEDDKLVSAYTKLKHQVLSKTELLADSRKKLAKAQKAVRGYDNRIAGYESELPKLRDRLKRREQQMKKKGLLKGEGLFD